MKNSFNKYILIFFICLPLFFINVKTSHDWGDDFAQYIHQAINITEGKTQSNTGYIYNPDYPSYAPPAYPSGFPLLLSPVYAVFGNCILYFDLYITLFLFIFALLLFKFLIRFYSALVSTLLIIIFIYNPWTLWFKLEIMSDIPFSTCFLLCVLMYTSKNNSGFRIVILTILTGFLLSIRNIGVVFLLAVLIDLIKDFYMARVEKTTSLFYKQIIEKLCIIAGGFLIFILINKVLIPSSGDGLFSYKYFFNLTQLKHFIQINLSYYMAVLRAFFEPWNDEWQFVALISGTMAFAFIILGMIKKMSIRFDFIDSLTLIYLTVIIVYPYSDAGFRFLFPIAQFLLYYLVQGIYSINISLKIGPKTLAVCMAIIVLCSYQNGFKEIYKSRNTIIEGPQVKENQELFEYIRMHTPPEAAFSFKKPRALSLYTSRNAMTHKRNQSLSDIHQSLLKNKISYIIINTVESDDSIKAYVNQRNLEKIWGNSKNEVYKLKE